MYKKYIEQLIDEVGEGLDLRIPIELITGFTGIGCTVEYLAQAGFIDENTDDILEAFDYRIDHIFKKEHCGEVALYHVFYYLVMRYSNKQETRKLQVKKKLSNLLTHTLQLIDQNLSQSPQLGTDNLDKFELFWNLPLTLLSVDHLCQTGFDKKSLENIIDKLQYISYHFLNSDINQWNRWYLRIVLDKLSGEKDLFNVDNFTYPEELSLQHGISGLLLISSLFDNCKPHQENFLRLLTEASINKESPYAGYELPETLNKFYKVGLISGIAGIGISQLVFEIENTLNSK